MKKNHLKALTKELNDIEQKIENIGLRGGNLSRLRTLTLQKELLKKAIEIYTLKNKVKWMQEL